MKKYMHLNTGEIYTEDEIKHDFEMFADDILDKDGNRKFDTFEEYFDHELQLGRDRVGGYVEVDEEEVKS